MEEIFASLVSALGGDKSGGAGSRGGRGGGGQPAPITLSVASFVEAGEGGFSQVTLTSGHGDSEGWGVDRRSWGSGRMAVSNG